MTFRLFQNRALASVVLFLTLLAFSTGTGQAVGDDSDLFSFRALGGNFFAPRTPAGSDGFIRVEGDQFVNDRGPIRFWGVNLCMKANFPPKEIGTAMAKRMADFGINIVRLHHMDMREIWGKNLPHQTEIDPEQLDRLDWLISEFKKNGIYININLHVSRKMREEDGFSDYDLRPEHDKGIDNYEPRMIKLQKKYAKDLLTHVNPYTKTAYINEPAVAMIEINNENSIIVSYLWWQLEAKCTEVYAKPLQKRWNQWLKKEYGTTENLRKYWKLVDIPLSEEMIQDSGFNGTKPDPKWILEQQSTSAGSIKIEEGALLFDIKKKGEFEWQPQIYYQPITIKKDLPYTISFRAKADEDGKTGDFSIYNTDNIMHEKFTLSKEWKTYTFTIPGALDVEEARFGFTWLQPGKYYFDDVSLRSGGKLGLPAGETIEKGNIHNIKRSLDNANTEKMRADYMRFLFDLENEYWQDLYRYVKEDLKARPPVTGTQLHYGAAYAQGRLDYVDIHSYWNHPNFPGGAWDGNNWYVTNKPLVNELGTSGSLASLASTRVIGRPYTVSEYNHPYPNFYGTEGFPMIAALAGFQDWNGIFIFDWAHTYELWHSAGFFDIHGNPSILVHMPACYDLFARGDVKSSLAAAKLSKSASIADISEESEQEAIQQALKGSTYAKDHLLDAPKSRVFEKYSGIRLTDLKIAESRTSDLKSLDPEQHKKQVEEKVDQTKSSTGELIWNAQKEGKGYFIVDTKKTKVFSGFVDGRTFKFSDGIQFIPGRSLLDWMTVSATELSPNRWLLAATGLYRNTDMKIRIYKKEDLTLPHAQLPDVPSSKIKDLINEKITYCRAPGGGPVRNEGIAAKFILPAPNKGKLVLKPLDENGKPKQVVEARRIDSKKVELEIGPQYKTLWYEIELIQK